MICSKVDSDWLLLVEDAAKCICKEKGIQKCPSVWSQSIPFFILKYIFIITFELIIIIHYAEGEFAMKRGWDGTIVQISIPWFFTFSSFYSMVVCLYALLLSSSSSHSLPSSLSSKLWPKCSTQRGYVDAVVSSDSTIGIGSIRNRTDGWMFRFVHIIYSDYNVNIFINKMFIMLPSMMREFNVLCLVACW